MLERHELYIRPRHPSGDEYRENGYREHRKKRQRRWPFDAENGGRNGDKEQSDERIAPVVPEDRQTRQYDENEDVIEREK